MKQLERIFLSIIRRPLKTILLALLVFVVANVISGSLILYQSTQSIKDEINASIRPAAILKTNFRFENEYPMFSNESNEDYSYEKIMNIKDLFDELKNDVAYHDYILISNDFYTSESIYKNGWKYENNDLLINEYKKAILTGIGNVDSILYKNNIIEIVEGRNFTDDELENGKNVIILHEGSAIIDENGKKTPIQVGDFIHIHDYVIDYEAYASDSNKYLEDDVKFNEWYKSLINYEKEYKYEVIGFYEVYDLENKTSNGKSYTPDIGYSILMDDYYMLVPQNALVSIVDEHENNGYSQLELSILTNYFELNESNHIQEFTDKVNELENKYQLNLDMQLNNDLYLKIAGPLEAVNSVSKLILIIGIVISIVVLSCVSILFMKERRKEIGVLLSMGESKKNIFRQVILEMMIICILAVGTSLFTTKAFSNQVSETIMGDKTYHIELSEEEKMMIGEDYSGAKLKNEYQESLNHSNIFVVGSISLVITVLSTGVSTLFVLKMKPKEILM